ncbi:MAG: hypothetical protein MJ204_10065 [Bacteroidales bacterium]|nr:hypothetical protein [Bacteroidales bacterium]
MLCIFSLPVFSQGEVETANKILFSDDYSASIGLNTNGFSLGFRYGKYVDYLHKTSYRVQIHSIRSAKEIRMATSYGMSIYGKDNNVGALAVLCGRRSEKFSKFDKNSVSIYLNYDGGLALAFEKPMYYHVLHPDGQDVIERFDATTYTKYGKASFSYGLNEMKFVPGVLAMTSAEFDFSQRKSFQTSVEIGASIQAYLRKLQIMCNDENNWAFATLFVKIRVGKLRNDF